MSERPTRWLAFGLVTGALLAVTTAESLLAPLFPTVAEDLALDLRLAGLAFGLLTGAIAAGNFAGGYLLARAGARVGLLASLVVAGSGCVLTALATGRTTFLLGQTVVGLGAGVFFPPALNAAGLLAGAQRRGLAMGIFGVAFSGGLTLAALLAAASAGVGWRPAFWAAAVACGVGVLAVAAAALPTRRTTPAGGVRKRLREAIGVPVWVGGVAAVSQYGTVAFLPLFAVLVWDMSPATAALLLAAARVLSVPAKLLAGAAADRWGGRGAVVGLSVLLTVTGAGWTLLPASVAAFLAAIVFAATVSGLFPVANLLALEGFGERGPLLGAYRSAQIALGAAGAYVIGVLSTAFGLTPTLTVAVLLPLTLLFVRRPAPAFEANGGTRHHRHPAATGRRR